MAVTTPVEEAERVLKRLSGFRKLGFDEADARALARSDATLRDVLSLLAKGCSKQLAARILT